MSITFICAFMLTFVTLVSGKANVNGVGYRVARTFFDLTDLPLNSTAAVSQGWTKSSSCSPNRGITFNPSDGVGSSMPLQLQYTSGGQLAGWTLWVYGQPAQNLVDLGYWEPNDSYYSLSVSTRSPSMMCSGKVDPSTPVGDSLTINQGGASFPIPLNVQSATQQKWVSGGCINGMGTHWSYDVATPGKMTWLSANLFPVLPMFMNGSITAVLINIPDLETTYPFGIWEGPFINSLYCYNWCPNSGCTFDNWWWTTTHFVFDDTSNNKCYGNECPSSN